MSERRTIPADEALLVAVSIGLAAWCARAYVADGYSLTRTIYVCQWSGYTALGLLALSLLTSPLGRGLGAQRINVDSIVLARLSRNAGIASALAALLHLFVVLTTYLDGNWWVVFEFPYLQSGALALALLVLLLLCSVKRLMALFGWQLWKPLFRLSFVAAILAFSHVLYAPFSSTRWVLWLFGGALVISLVRLLPARVSKPPAAASRHVAETPATIEIPSPPDELPATVAIGPFGMRDQ